MKNKDYDSLTDEEKESIAKILNRGKNIRPERNMWNRFWSWMYCLFFNEEKHKLRLGPFLWMFSVNIMVMMSTMGWGIVYLLANEKTIPTSIVIAFFGNMFVFTLNIITLYMFKKLSSNPQSMVIGTMANSFDTKTGQTKSTGSPSSPSKGKGVPASPKVQTGNNS